jgi:PhnB protein
MFVPNFKSINMKTTINAYISFNGKCREAMTFYKECIGGELTIQTVEGSPIETQCPAAMKHQVLHSALIKDQLVIMGTDMAHGEYIQGNNINLAVNCSSQEEIESFFAALQVGGKVIDPLKDQFWGAMFGVLVDKYGIGWMFSFNKSQE